MAEQVDTGSREGHDFRNPKPTSSQRRKRRRWGYDLRNGLRRLNSPRVAACGRKRVAYEVEIVRRSVERREGGPYQHAYYRGLLRCGSVWECPVCALQIRAERAAELKAAVETWGPASVAMLSLTVRHGLGHDLRAVRAGLTSAYRRLIRGKPWKHFCAKFGLEHQVRAVEVTHGENGWHPHLHALLFLGGKLADEEQEEASEWFRSRWARCVRRALGSEFVPNDEHGVDLRESRRADYLAKFSFELADPGTKRGRRGNRTPLEIGVSAASRECPEDEKLWVAYCEGMRGAKMLTWSRDLRDFVGLDDEKTDQEVVDGEEQREAEIVATIPSDVWDAVRDRRGLACAILEAAELAVGPSDGHEAIQGLVCESRARPPPDDP